MSSVSFESLRRGIHLPERIALQQRTNSAKPWRMSKKPANGMRVLKKYIWMRAGEFQLTSLYLQLSEAISQPYQNKANIPGKKKIK